MIRPGRNVRYSATTGSTGSDTDGLQTDVMRFMAILGLCLMAIFALVQSIPLKETEALPTDHERDKLHTDMIVQQEHDRVLQANLDHLMEQIHAAETRKTLTQQALSSAQQQLTRVVDQTQKARSEQQHLKAELDDMQYKITVKQKKLAGVEQYVHNPAQPPAAGRQHLQERRIKLDDISKQASILKKNEPPIPLSTDAREPPDPAPTPERKGFTLRFASDKALEQQVASGSVSLYAMADKQAWRLSLDHGRPAFSKDAFPGWFHEMASSTVPNRYAHTLGKSIDRNKQSSIVWGVQLSPVTKREITSLTSNLQGGTLVIEANGQVTLKPE